MPCVNAHIVRVDQVRAAFERRERLNACLSRTCEIDNHYIFFIPDRMEWLNGEVGVIKYSALTSSDPWGLKELIIEELL